MDSQADFDGQLAEEAAWAETVRRISSDGQARGVVTPFGAYKDDLVRFGRVILGHRYWAAQEAIMQRLLDKRRVTVRAPRKVGKTFGVAATALGFLQTRPSIVIATATTGRQVKELVFAHMRTGFSRARTRLLGEMGVQTLRIEPDWYAIGVSTDQPENILGFHAGVEVPDDEAGEPPSDEETAGAMAELFDRARTDAPTHDLLIIFDEAQKIRQPIFDAISGSLMGPRTYAIMQGNPTISADEAHTYARSFKAGSGWHRIHIAATDTPDDPTPSDECFHNPPPWLLDPAWVEQQRREWGEDNPLFQAYVLGCFADQKLDKQIIPHSLLESCADLEIPDDGDPASRHIGCDVAASENQGRDWCVATLWICGVLSAEHKWRTGDTMATAGMLVRLAQEWGVGGVAIPAKNIHVDATGVGKGPVDRLRQTGLMVDAVDFGSRPRRDWRHLTGELIFRNRKSELFWALRRALQEGRASIPRKYGDVWRQLQWHTYLDPGDARLRGSESMIAIAESKDDLRELYGRSPDNADAAVIAWSRGFAKPTIRVVSPSTVLRRRRFA